MVVDQHTLLKRIASSNSPSTTGPGFDGRELVPAFTINNRALSRMLERSLREAGIESRLCHGRLTTQFFVRSEQFSKSLALRDELLRTRPDTPPRKFSRDYDSVILLLPLTAVAAFISHITPNISNYVWIAVVVTGVSAVFALERLNRQARYYFRLHWGLSEMFWITAIVAVNIVVWKVVL